MKKIVMLVFLCCGMLLNESFAQVVTFKNADKKAANYASEARISMMQGQPLKAIEYLKMALEVEPNFIDVLSTLGSFYFEFNNDLSKAEECFNKVIELDPKYDYNVYIKLAQIKLKQQKYDEAISNANFVINVNDDAASDKIKSECKRILGNAEFSREAMKHPVDFNPINIGNSINSNYDDYFAALNADGSSLYFTRLDVTNRMPQEDIYSSDYINNKWTLAKPLNNLINSPEFNEGAIAISPSGKHLLFTKCESPDCVGKCDIFTSKRIGDDWSAPNNLSYVINTKNWESQPSISGDGKDFYFTQRTPQNQIDIFVSHIDEKTGFSTPINLGNIINTPFNEERPFIHPDNKTLYFISDGHPGLGGKDIYMSVKDSEGKWTTPKNLGYPINTSDDEFGIFVSSNGKTAYISSVRKDGFGGLDIYYFDLPEAARPAQVTYVKGIVTDADTKMPLQANIQLFDIESGNKVMSMSSDAKNGSFLVTLPVGKDYMYNVSKDGYLFYSENFSLKNYTSNEPFQLNVALNKIKEGVSIVLKNIFFETAKATLKDESKTELNKLVELMTKNTTIKIEIGGHTDNVGADAENLKLSEARALTVKNYLIANGISADRLTSKGYGETMPIADNTTEVGRANNRRTEFKVIAK